MISLIKLSRLNLLKYICWNPIFFLVVGLGDVLLQINVHSDYFLDFWESKTPHFLEGQEEYDGEDKTQKEEGACTGELDADDVGFSGEDDAFFVVEDSQGD